MDGEGDAQGSEVAQDTGEVNDGLASGFLSKIPEGDRDVVGKYVKQWDAGVTRRFQELHSQYAPYKELGELESLQNAVKLYEMLDNEPERVYHALREAFEDGDLEVPGSGQQQSEDGSELDPKFQGLYDELQERLNKQNEVLEAIAEYVIDTHKSQQASQEDRELDEYLGLLHEEFGDFDEKFVLTQMYHGASGDEAVEAWNEMIQQHVNNAGQATEGLPSVLSSQGGGAVPREGQQRMGQVPQKDIRNLVADVMSQANRESQ